jgi:hypothetical protein
MTMAGFIDNLDVQRNFLSPLSRQILEPEAEGRRDRNLDPEIDIRRLHDEGNRLRATTRAALGDENVVAPGGNPPEPERPILQREGPSLDAIAVQARPTSSQRSTVLLGHDDPRNLRAAGHHVVSDVLLAGPKFETSDVKQPNVEPVPARRRVDAEPTNGICTGHEMSVLQAHGQATCRTRVFVGQLSADDAPVILDRCLGVGRGRRGGYLVRSARLEPDRIARSGALRSVWCSTEDQHPAHRDSGHRNG